MKKKLEQSKNVLFILKKQAELNQDNPKLSSGLFNSVNFVHEMLLNNNIDSAIAIAEDNNDIDRIVSQSSADSVFIEALWVLPSKFAELIVLHPNITWYIHVHSNIPFLAQEGIALSWLADYAKFPEIQIVCNNPNGTNEISKFLLAQQINDKVIYLPNYFPIDFVTKKYRSTNIVNIGCFGSIRPLKNTLIQAIAAIEYCENNNKRLIFHINDRIEQSGDQVLKNLIAIFDNLPQHQLVMHQWAEREEYLKLVIQMDVVLQVSFTETFNIVAADAVSVSVPLVCSSEIFWAHPSSFVKTTLGQSIVDGISKAYTDPYSNVLLNQSELKKFAKKSQMEWLNFIN